MVGTEDEIFRSVHEEGYQDRYENERRVEGSWEDIINKLREKNLGLAGMIGGLGELREGFDEALNSGDVGDRGILLRLNYSDLSDLAAALKDLHEAKDKQTVKKLVIAAFRSIGL